MLQLSNGTEVYEFWVDSNKIDFFDYLLRLKPNGKNIPSIILFSKPYFPGDTVTNINRCNAERIYEIFVHDTVRNTEPEYEIKVTLTIYEDGNIEHIHPNYIRSHVKDNPEMHYLDVGDARIINSNSLWQVQISDRDSLFVMPEIPFLYKDDNEKLFKIGVNR